MSADPCACQTGGYDRPPCSVPGGCGSGTTVGLCRRGRHCSSPDSLPGQPATTDTRPLCEDDIWELGSAITDLPTLLAALEGELWRTFPSDTGYDRDRPGSRTPPIPLRESVDELMRDLVDVARCWAEIVADRAGLPVLGAPPRSRSVRPARLRLSLGESVRVLAPRIPVLLALPRVEVDRDGWVAMDGGDAAVELLNLHHRARVVTRYRRRTERFPNDPCPACGQPRVTHLDGHALVRCGGCGRTETWETWDRLREQKAS